MTEIIAYDQLTWPKVSALDRDIPLVIPLGSGFSHEQLTIALGEPARIGLLPEIPFGWRGSGLEVPEPKLVSLVQNLQDSLREDSFTHVVVAAPSGSDLKMSADQIDIPVTTEFPADQIPQESEGGKVVVLPIGHTEQHGFHLPLSTDTLIIDAIGRGTAHAVPEKAVCLPVMPYGVSMHRRSFAGTLNCGGRAFEDFWLGVIDTLAARGFDRFYLMSGHGGNCSFLVNVVKYAGERHRRIFCATAWLYLSGPQGISALEAHRQSTTGGMGHACELETSLLLHLRPDLVQMQSVVDETAFIATPSYFMDWIEGGALVANPPWEDDTRTGAYGMGSVATSEHGQIWLEAAIAEKAAHVAEIHEQQRRRELRRKNHFGLWGIDSASTL